MFNFDLKEIATKLVDGKWDEQEFTIGKTSFKVERIGAMKEDAILDDFFEELGLRGAQELKFLFTDIDLLKTQALIQLFLKLSKDYKRRLRDVMFTYTRYKHHDGESVQADTVGLGRIGAGRARSGRVPVPSGGARAARLLALPMVDFQGFLLRPRLAESGEIGRFSPGFTPVRPLMMKPMFAAIIDHGYASYIDLRDRMTLEEAASLEDALVARVENERRARSASGADSGLQHGDAPTPTR